MTVYKNKENKTWEAQACYTSWGGEKKRKHKRGFKTKAKALAWKREFLCGRTRELDVPFSAFYNLYLEDRSPRLRLSTIAGKNSLVRARILPYFGDCLMSKISPRDILLWQNELISWRNESGQGYSETYLRSINNQISAIFSHACKYYKLGENPVRIAGSMGKKDPDSFSFWTLEEYQQFSRECSEDKAFHCAFEVLYWTGIRIGELLALTKDDIDFQTESLTVSKSYQRINGESVVTAPKTVKSNRVIALPTTLCSNLQEYCSSLNSNGESSRLFQFSKDAMRVHLKSIAEKVNLKPIRVHDLRHSHASHLVELGYSLTIIAERLGHADIDTTYRYSHLFSGKQEEVAIKLNSEMESIVNQRLETSTK